MPGTAEVRLLFVFDAAREAIVLVAGDKAGRWRTWDAPERVASRERSRAAMRAEQRGYQLPQLRKNTGLTQAQVAAVMGVSQARVSQIEHGKVTEVDAIRGYVEALGGTVDVVARVGDWTVRVA